MENQTQQKRNTLEIVRKGLVARRRKERWFIRYGLGAILLGLSFLAFLFFTIIGNGYTALQKTTVQLEVFFDPQVLDPDGKHDPKILSSADYGILWKASVQKLFPDVSNRNDKKRLFDLVSPGATYQLREMVMQSPALVGTTQMVRVPANDDVDMFFKGHATAIHHYKPQGILSPTGVEGEIQLLSTSNDFFAGRLVNIKKHLTRRLNKLNQEVARQRELAQDVGYVVTKLQDRLTQQRSQDGAPEYIAKLEKELAETLQRQEQFQRQADEKNAKIPDLQKRLDSIGGEEDLVDVMPSYLIQLNGGLVKATRINNNGMTGQVIKKLESTQDATAGAWSVMEFVTPEGERRQKDIDIARIIQLQERGLVQTEFNTTFFTGGDSREPELAGIWGATVGSFYTLLITLALSFPIGVASAVYLEEFAPRNRWTDLIEVNINNLAAVPSIVFGLLGLAVFINFFGMPRSAPLVGGVVLALMALPTIIIAGRAALKSVPPSIREAALGIGASKMQMIFHHVLPLALPGMLTGTIIGMAHALGETAPLLMIGMVAFIVDIPGGFTDPATVLPVQVYLWADSPERAFVEKTSAAIMVLLLFLILMNGIAVFLRKKFERRW